VIDDATQRIVHVSLREALELGHFFDATYLRTAATDNEILYHAMRDMLPPVEDISGRWRFDRVWWDGGDLPTTELRRAIGHVNPVFQSELFICRSGYAYIASRRPETCVIEIHCCPAGSAVWLPEGSWHLTWVESQPAVVENCYFVPAQVDAGKHYDRLAGQTQSVALLRSRIGPPQIVNTGARSVMVVQVFAPRMATGEVDWTIVLPTDVVQNVANAQRQEPREPPLTLRPLARAQLAGN
jgi:hypothetical protein